MIKTQSDKIREMSCNQSSFVKALHAIMATHDIEISVDGKGNILFSNHNTTFLEFDYDIITESDLEEVLEIYG